MADEADNAHVTEQHNLEASLSFRKPIESVEPTGRCNYCGLAVELPKLYCDGACATKHASKKRSR